LTPQEKSDLENIVRIVSSCSKVDAAVLFGSRAKGNHRDSSDWDIALKGSELSLSDVLSMQVQIDELWLPCAVDIVIYNTIENHVLKDHIDRVGIAVWNRNVL
jgi:predicted nucleotidyltransferase